MRKFNILKVTVLITSKHKIEKCAFPRNKSTVKKNQSLLNNDSCAANCIWRKLQRKKINVKICLQLKWNLTFGMIETYVFSYQHLCMPYEKFTVEIDLFFLSWSRLIREECLNLKIHFLLRKYIVIQEKSGNKIIIT